MTVLTDSIFTYTESLLAGTSIQYKFVNGNTAAGYESVPFACASNDNRTLLVPEEDIILNTICFSGCDTCVIIGLPEYGVSDAALLQNFPNPGSELTRIGYIIPERGTLQLTVYNSMGQLVSLLVDGPCTPGTYTRELQCAGLPQGVYSYRMVFSGQKRTFIANKKMIVN
jgi:hypothetical protein